MAGSHRDARAFPAMTTSKFAEEAERRDAYAASAALAFSAIAWNAAGSVMARSDSTLRSTVMPDFDKAVDKDAVGHAERTNRGIDALDPERAERALLALAVAEGILPGLFDRGLGGADGVLAAAAETLGGLVDFLVLGVRGHTAFDARHDCYP